MNADRLAQYIFGQDEITSPTVSNWIESSTRFAKFVDDFREKIRNKIKNAKKDKDNPIESLKDVLFELEIGYLLCKTPRFSSVEYEQSKKGPDYAITVDPDIVFNMEVKRIRPGESHQALFDQWKSEIKREIQKIESPLACDMKFCNDGDPMNFAQRLKGQTPSIISFINNKLPDVEVAILKGTKQVISLPVQNFENEFMLNFRQPPYSTKTLVVEVCESPMFRNEKAYRKFDDLCVSVLKQVGEKKMINILVVNTDSKTHDFLSLIFSLSFFKETMQDKKITNSDLLSGVLFKGAWIRVGGYPNYLWCNGEADFPIPESIKEDLQKMN